MRKFLESRVVILMTLILTLSIIFAPDDVNSQAGQSCLPNDRVHRVSITYDGSEPNGNSWQPVLSADGRYVAFVSEASNLVEGDTNGVADIFWLDRQTCEVVRVSNDTTAAANPSISADGQVIAFDTWAGVVVHDRRTGESAIASMSSEGVEAAEAYNSSISADGRYITFTARTRGWNGVEPEQCQTGSYPVGDDEVIWEPVYGLCTHVFVRDRATNETKKLTSEAYYSVISANGRYIALFVRAYEIDVYDMQQGSQAHAIINLDSIIQLPISISPDGQMVAVHYYGLWNDGQAHAPILLATLSSEQPELRAIVTIPVEDIVPKISAIAFSANGRFIVYDYGVNPVAGTGVATIYLYDTENETSYALADVLTQKGIADPAPPPLPTLSTNGQWVAFGGYSTNLLPNEENQVTHIYLVPTSWPS